MSKELQKIMKNVNSFSKEIPSADILSVINELVIANKENQQIKKDIVLIEANTNLLIKEMTLKYDLYHMIFNKIFDERTSAINKSFEIIDKGVKENNRELISIGLNSLSTIVASSPFGNISELSKLLESNKVIEI